MGTFRIPSLILVKRVTGVLHIMPLSNSEFLYTSLGSVTETLPVFYVFLSNKIQFGTLDVHKTVLRHTEFHKYRHSGSRTLSKVVY